jgi:hypothetical protein
VSGVETKKITDQTIRCLAWESVSRRLLLLLLGKNCGGGISG